MLFWISLPSTSFLFGLVLFFLYLGDLEIVLAIMISASWSMHASFLFSKVKVKRVPQSESAHEILEENSDLSSLYACHFDWPWLTLGIMNIIILLSSVPTIMSEGLRTMIVIWVEHHGFQVWASIPKWEWWVKKMLCRQIQSIIFYRELIEWVNINTILKTLIHP